MVDEETTLRYSRIQRFDNRDILYMGHIYLIMHKSLLQWRFTSIHIESFQGKHDVHIYNQMTLNPHGHGMGDFIFCSWSAHAQMAKAPVGSVGEDIWIW